MPKRANSDMNFDNIHYRKNYLTNVVARLDFLSPLEKINTKLPSKITKQIKRYFPIAEPQHLVATEFQIAPGIETKTKETTVTEWKFFGKERDKTLTLGNAAIFVEYSLYTSYEVIKKEFLDVLNVCFEVFPELQGKRLGLRYINNINLPSGDPLAWGDYLDSKMLGIFDFATDQKYLSRVFHILDYNYGDYSLRYQFGLANPDYPASIKQKAFVLDIDTYYQGLYDREEVSGSLDKFHEKSQTLFELSITDQFRRILNG